MVLRKLPESFNFAAAESYDLVNTAIIHLTKRGSGKNISRLLLEYVASTSHQLKSNTKLIPNSHCRSFETQFSPSLWTGNGPDLLTRVLRTICKTNDTSQMTDTLCTHQFTVLRSDTCYAIPYGVWYLFFKTFYRESVLKSLHKSIVTHFWNALSSQTPVRKGDHSAYDVLARNHCPRVYKVAGEFF